MNSRKALLVYIIFIHILLILILIKSNFIDRMGARLGIYTPTELSAYYDKVTTYHSRMDGNIPEGATLFIGDSITQALATSAIAELSVNYGIGNDTTVGVLNRIKLYESLDRAKAIVIAIGINDLNKRDDERIISNFQSILDYLPDDVQIVLNAILPVDEKVKTVSAKNIRISRLNGMLLRLAEKYNNVTFLDVGILLQGPDKNLKSDLHVGDGIHPNSIGYKIWIEQLKISLKSR